MPEVPGSDHLLTYQIQSMDAISSTDVWAVGGSGDNASPYGGTLSNTLIEHYNGTAWSVVTSPDTGTNDNLTGVTETSPANLTAVGYATPPKGTGAQTLTMTWNGTAWAIEPSPKCRHPERLDVSVHRTRRRDSAGGRLRRSPRLLEPARHAERLTLLQPQLGEGVAASPSALGPSRRSTTPWPANNQNSADASVQIRSG